MYIEHPFFYDGKYFAKVDGEFIEISKEVAYAMNNFYRSGKPKKIEIKNEQGEVVEKKLREVPYGEASSPDCNFFIESFPDVHCDVEGSAMEQVEHQEVRQVIGQLDSEERMLVYGIYFENKTQAEMASIMGVSQQAVAYKLKKVLNKMRKMF